MVDQEKQATPKKRVSVGFINPGSLGDRLPYQGSAQADSTQLMGRPKSLKQQAEKGGPVTDRKVWPKRNSPRSSTTLAHRSDRSARFGLQQPRDGLSDRKAWPKHYFRLRPRVSDRGSQEPCSPLFFD